ncbi:MAG: cyclic nucleotide-binding domain-containing protein [Halobacteriovoraceae bacterium]|nr:cyclic nucleotide-binding domain-containing protein [Halobacteriovoraceae bacterium]
MENFDPTQVAGHVAYFLIFISFLVKRMLLLRGFAIAASCLSLFYSFNTTGGPLWVPIQWNFVFIAVNLYHITKIFISMRPVELNNTQKQAYQSAFKSMPIKDFRNFFDLGITRTYNPKDILINQGQELPALFFIINGKVDIFINGKYVNSLSKNQFIGEMSFLTRELTTAKVILSSESKIHYWDRPSLDKYFKKNPDMLTKIHAAIGTQLIGHIVQQEFEKAI